MNGHSSSGTSKTTTTLASQHHFAISSEDDRGVLLPRDSLVCLRLPYCYTVSRDGSSALVTTANASEGCSLAKDGYLLPHWLVPAAAGKEEGGAQAVKDAQAGNGGDWLSLMALDYVMPEPEEDDEEEEVDAEDEGKAELYDEKDDDGGDGSSPSSRSPRGERSSEGLPPTPEKKQEGG